MGTLLLFSNCANSHGFPFRGTSKAQQLNCPSLWLFFPESTSESTVPKLRARGHRLGSTWCPFGTVVFLQRSSCVLGATSPKKQSCLKYLTWLSWRNTLGWEIPCPALPHLPLTNHCMRVVPTIFLLTQGIFIICAGKLEAAGKIHVANNGSSCSRRAVVSFCSRIFTPESPLALPVSGGNQDQVSPSHVIPYKYCPLNDYGVAILQNKQYFWTTA